MGGPPGRAVPNARRRGAPPARVSGAERAGARLIAAGDEEGELAEPRAGRSSRLYAWLVVWLSPLVVLACVAATVVAYRVLPSVSSAPAASLSDLLPAHPAAVQAEEDALRLFHLPVLTPFVLVQRNPHGLSAAAQADAYGIAARATTHHNPGLGPLAAAVPIVNTLGLFPGARERSTTAVTYLYFGRGTSAQSGYKYAKRYASLFRPQDDVVGVSGALPARIEQYKTIQSHLHLVELATVALVLLIVGIAFRAVLAPILTIVTAGLAFVVSQHVLGWIGKATGLSVPRELTPVAVALMLGIVTDYSVFFFFGTRRRLAAGDSRTRAVRCTVASYGPIVLTAGLLVAMGSATLMVGTLGFFRSFGPGMAITVAAGLVMSLTFVPAALTLLGRWAFWPGLSRNDPPRTAGLRRRLARVLTARPVAAVLVTISVAALVAAATGLARTQLGLALVSSLPGGNPVAKAGAAAGAGFAPGILAPTELIVRGSGVASRHAELGRLEGELRRERGVAAVLGPAEQPTAKRFGLFLAPGGDAARFALVLDHEPTGAPAIASLRRIEGRSRALLTRAGLGSAHAEYAGETALGVDTVVSVGTSIWRIALAVLGVNFVFLVIFLRGIIAPLYLLFASAAGLAATFGVTTYLFQGLLGTGGITYYLPIAIGVLLVSLGSDYNLFVVGRIRQAAERRRLRDAVQSAAPRAGRAIGIAGIAMAFSFALLALVPLRMFRVFAFAMSFGILLDALLVRTVLVPGLIVLFRHVRSRSSRQEFDGEAS